MERHGRNDADCRGLVGAERFKRRPEGRRYLRTTPEEAAGACSAGRSPRSPAAFSAASCNQVLLRSEHVSPSANRPYGSHLLCHHKFAAKSCAFLSGRANTSPRITRYGKAPKNFL